MFNHVREGMGRTYSQGALNFRVIKAQGKTTTTTTTTTTTKYCVRDPLFPPPYNTINFQPFSLLSLFTNLNQPYCIINIIYTLYFLK